jgi:hypothetical protein
MRRLLATAALGAVLAVGLAACGDDEEVPTLPPPSLEQWQARVNGYCSDGVQEAVALPLPQTTRQVPEDAQARASILLDVHDAVLPLAQPPEQTTQINSWMGELDADAKLLKKIAVKAAAGLDYLTLAGELDESSGVAANELGLDQCAALANAIARTP